MKIVFIGTEPKVSISFGGRSVEVERGKEIEIPEDWANGLVEGPNFIEADKCAGRDPEEVRVLKEQARVEAEAEMNRLASVEQKIKDLKTTLRSLGQEIPEELSEKPA